MLLLKRSLLISGILLFTSACQNQNEHQSKSDELAGNTEQILKSEPIGGIINSGEYDGHKFMLYSGEEVNTMMKMVEAYNRLDANELNKYIADSIKMLTPDGQVVYSKTGDMVGYFSTLDSVHWIVDVVIPLKIEDTDVVKILLDTRETAFPKNGSPYGISLLEEFSFENGKVVSIRQWTRELLE